MKIRFFDRTGKYVSELPPFEISILNAEVRTATEAISRFDKFAGWTVFEWHEDKQQWWTYKPDGINDATYDAGRRSDHISSVPVRTPPMMF